MSSSLMSTDLTRGSLVVDRYADDVPDADPEDERRAVVLAVHRETPAAYYAVNDGTTLADFETNHGFDLQTPAVTVAFEKNLDRNAPGWRDEDPTELFRWLAQFKREWSVRLQTYAYPASRLRECGTTYCDDEPRGTTRKDGASP